MATALEASGASAPKRRARHQLTIATFHRVLPEALRSRYPLPGLCVTPEELDWFLGFFQQRYDVMPLAHAWRLYQAGAPTERPLLALTFDDGERDNLEYAWPVMQRHGVRGSFYLATAHADSGEPIWHDQIGFALLRAIEQGKTEGAGSILGRTLGPDSVAACIEATKTLSPTERSDQVARLSDLTTGGVPDWAALMDWSDARVLQRAGNEIGSHSLSHPLLPQCDDAWLERELRDSKVRIESELGTGVETFCYPNGDADGRVARAAERAGYACAVTTTWGMSDASVAPFLLRRCDINAEHVVDRTGQLSAARLQLRLSGLQPGL